MAKGRTAAVQAVQTDLVEGECYLFESITSHQYVGRLHSITGPNSVVLTDCAWVADTGRLHEFLRDGRAAQMEVEPVGVRGLVWASWSPWPHPLLTEAV